MAKPTGIATRATTGFQINDGPEMSGTLSVDSNSEVIWSSGARPDPTWQAVDSNGHFHARAKDETYPTLKTRSEHIRCDGSCAGACQDEGYTIIHYDCVICGEEVEPGTIPGPYSVTIPGIQTWSITVLSQAPVGLRSERVTVRFEYAGALHFGVAEVGSIVAHRSDADGEQLETELFGVSPLGEQPVTGHELWTTAQAAEHCGVKPGTFRDYQHRLDAPGPVSSEPGRGGQDLYDADEVRRWHAARRGRGARTDLRP